MTRQITENSLRAASGPDGKITRITSNEVGDTSPTLCGKRSLWIMNASKPEADGIVARSLGTRYIGRPCQTLTHSVRELEDMNNVGIYEDYTNDRV